MKTALTPKDKIKNNPTDSQSKKIITSLTVMNNRCTWSKLFTSDGFGLDWTRGNNYLIIHKFLDYDQNDQEIIAIFSLIDFSISEIERTYKNY
jgi:hypothetical protein